MQLDEFSPLAATAKKVLDNATERYKDSLQPATKASGTVLELVPRAINAALEPLHQWILKKEFNIEKTKLLLSKELENTSECKIITPEPYVAVPAFQAISYCMDSDELRSLFAKLLAKSMNSDTKDSVLPSFVEVIKQISPIDAVTLKALIPHHVCPVCKIISRAVGHGMYYLNKDQGIKAEQSIFADSSISFKTLFEHYIVIDNIDYDFETVGVSISNLCRLGIIEANYSLSLDGIYYEKFVNTPFLNKFIEEWKSIKTDEEHRVRLLRGIVTITSFGYEFIKVCID